MERDFIAWLRTRLPREHAALVVGPGDDAAVLKPIAAGSVVTTDMLMDGVDFRLAEVDVRRIGRKALAVNLSDLAAMAARPVAALVSLALPRAGGLEIARQLYEGLMPLAAKFDLAIAGGDTNSWDGPLVVSVTAMGAAHERGSWLRSGAQPGDMIVVTGSLGGSILGKHFDFTPRIREALLLRDRYDVRAAMDISDGLALDLTRLCEESGCGAELMTAAVPIADAAKQLAKQEPGGKALPHALSDGEDFELLMAMPPAEAERAVHEQPLGDVKLSIIGRFIAESELWSVDAEAHRTKLEPRGYEHRLS